MKLKTLTLTNFEGIRSLTINADGKSASIYGDNGTGKTTIADAQAWLLFDKDSAFTTNFSPKPCNDQGEEIHNLNTEVEGTYILDDGAEITFRKVFFENWKKKRGSTKAFLEGNTVDHYVNGVPKSKGEYKDILSSIASEQIIMLLSIPHYFPEILDDKTSRRELLMSLEKDIHEFDVISACEELEPLRHLMLKPGATANWYDMDEFVQIKKAEAKKANEDLKEIPGRIDEQTRISCELTEEDVKKLKAESGRLNAEKISLQLEMNASESDMMLSLKADIARLNAKLEEKRAEHIRKESEKNAETNDKIAELRREGCEHNEAALELRAEGRTLMREIQRLRAEREQMVEQWKAVNKSEWAGDTVCPTCGQAIPADKVEAAKAEFNLKKSEKLAELNERGKTQCSQGMIAELEAKYEAVNSKALVEENASKKATDEVTTLRQSIEGQAFESTQIYADIMRDIETTQAQLNALGETRAKKNAEWLDKISGIDTKLAEISADIARYDASVTSRERIAELEQQEKLLTEAYARARQGLDLAELFERKKAEMLTEKINSHFKNVRFRLFRVQINEGIRPDCEVLALTANGYIPYSTANNAARITAGLEIIRGFGRHFGLTMPVFVDNAESITKLDTDGLQVIRLVVSGNDKVLRFETDKTEV